MPLGDELFRNEREKTELEERNSRLQFDEMNGLIRTMGGTLAITPEIVKRLQGKATQGIHTWAGQYRTWPVAIRGSKHRPPSFETVPGFVEQMCEDANSNLDWEPTKTAAYLLWRLNWIHPFGDGNGRTSRVVSYLALSVRLKRELPGRLTIPRLLTMNRRAYQEALEDADDAWSSQVLDISRMEALLTRLLENQLESVQDPDQ